MIHVLIVDDSPVAREHLEDILGQDPEITVIGTAENGREAIQAVRDLKPDVVIMDSTMPVMNGIEATRFIMKAIPVPIIIVTGSENVNEVVTSFAAMEAGAVSLVARPPGIQNPEYESSVNMLRNEVKNYVDLNFVKGYQRIWDSSTTQTYLEKELKLNIQVDQIKIVAIGASTGGPIVLQTLLSGFHDRFPLPIVIVQHIAKGFTSGLSEWLWQTTGFPTHIATHGSIPLPGHAYICPDGFQMGFTHENKISLTPPLQEKELCPSVNFLFNAVKEEYGSGVIAILLTGMGCDGAYELKNLKDNGAVTIVQDKESSIIFGMPGEAIRLGGASYVLSPEKIVDVVNTIVTYRRA